MGGEMELEGAPSPRLSLSKLCFPQCVPGTAIPQDSPRPASVPSRVGSRSPREESPGQLVASWHLGVRGFSRRPK